MTIAELVLALKRAAERSGLGLETQVYAQAPSSEEVLAVSKIEVDDEGDCMLTLI